jgi:PKD repeat protein
VVAAFELPSTIQFGDNGTTVDVTNSSSGATSYEWNFGDGNTATGEVTTIDYTYEFLSDIADVTVTLTATSATGCVDISTNTVDVSYVGIDELNEISIVAYPNPTKENLVISSAKVINSIQIFDGVGRCVYSNMNANSIQMNITLASFEAGVYTALIKGDNFSSEIRLIKE